MDGPQHLTIFYTEEFKEAFELEGLHLPPPGTSLILGDGHAQYEVVGVGLRVHGLSRATAAIQVRLTAVTDSFTVDVSHMSEDELDRLAAARRSPGLEMLSDGALDRVRDGAVWSKWLKPSIEPTR